MPPSYLSVLLLISIHDGMITPDVLGNVIEDFVVVIDDNCGVFIDGDFDAKLLIINIKSKIDTFFGKDSIIKILWKFLRRFSIDL